MFSVNVQFSSGFVPCPKISVHQLSMFSVFTYFVDHITYKSPWPGSLVNSCQFTMFFGRISMMFVVFSAQTSPKFNQLQSTAINLFFPVLSISPSIPKEGILRNALSKDVDLRLHLLEPRPGCREIAQRCGAEDGVVQQTHGGWHHLWWLVGEPSQNRRNQWGKISGSRGSLGFDNFKWDLLLILV